MIRALTAAALVVAVATPLAANTTVSADFAGVVAKATFIVRGRVTEVRVERSPGVGVETIATVAIDHVIKGGSAPFVHVRVPGGVLGGSRFVMPGAPTLAVHDHAVFFLKQGADNGWRPVGLTSGIYRVRTDAATQRPVIQAPVVAGVTAPSAGRIVRGDPKRKPLPVGEFESLVRLVMVAGSRVVPRGAGR